MTRISPVVLRSVEHIYWPRPEAEWGVTPQRWDEYKGQFAALESEQGLFHSPESGDLMVFVYTWNFTFFGTTLSFVHCGDRQPPQQRIAPCATREEAGASDGQGEVLRFRKVADGWYIYYVGKAIGAVAP